MCTRFNSCLTHSSFLATNPKVSHSVENQHSDIVLRMLLMKENMKRSVLQSRNTPELVKPSTTPKFKNNLSLLSTEERGGFVCGECGRTYKLKSSLRNHRKWECGKEPQFECPYCSYKAKQKMHMARHMERMHNDIDFSDVKNDIEIEYPKLSEIIDGRHGDEK
ncbi:hypothetical protein JTB14_025583 [Gonioctena quinquepunctata]|nr:hypothetical protein JTB14_025583 [Gonioctena quinquepunctata]